MEIDDTEGLAKQVKEAIEATAKNPSEVPELALKNSPAIYVWGELIAYRVAARFRLRSICTAKHIDERCGKPGELSFDHILQAFNHSATTKLPDSLAYELEQFRKTTHYAEWGEVPLGGTIPTKDEIEQALKNAPKILKDLASFASQSTGSATH